MTVPYIFANATGTVALAELDANFANVSAHVDTAGTVTENAQPNITSVGVLNSVSVIGNVIGLQFIGIGNTLSDIQGANVSGSVNQATYANVANSVAGANVSGSVNQATYANTANSVAGANVSGSVAQATYANVANSVAGANVSGSVNQATYANTANSVAGANVSGSVAQATYANTANAVAGANVSGSVNQATYANTANSVAGANVSGSVNRATYANIANSVAGANVSGQVASALIAGTVYTNAQPNITTVGILSEVSVAGNAYARNYFGSSINSDNGNLIISANIAQPELAWSISNDSFGLGTSILLAPLSDDHHIGEIVLPGSTGNGTIAYAGPNNGPFSNAVNIISNQGNILLTTTPDGSIFYISTFDQTGNFDVVGNVTANGIGSLSGNLIISANIAEPELAWTLVDDYFGTGTSILLAPLSDDAHTGEIILPGSTGSGYIAYSGPNNGLLSNALSISSDANILITQLSNVTSYITTFDTDGDWLMPNNVSVTGNVSTSGNVVFQNGSKFNSAAWTLIETVHANLTFGNQAVSTVNSFTYYSTNYNEILCLSSSGGGEGGTIVIPVQAVTANSVWNINQQIGFKWANLSNANVTVVGIGGGPYTSVSFTIYAR